MCQRSAQPFSCRNQSDLFRSAVQHGDGCRRRFSIRQTRSPKQARGFWCLFLKKARPICDGAPRPRSPRSFSPSFAPCRPPDAPHTSPPQPEIPFPRHSDSTSSPTPAVSVAPTNRPAILRFTIPIPSAADARRMEGKGEHNSPPQPAILFPVLRPHNTPSPHHTVPSCPTSSRCLCAETSLPLSFVPFVQYFELPSKAC